MKSLKLISSVFLGFIVSFFFIGQASATLEQAKLYQSVFGGDKPKCQTCHVDKVPKKADGKHEWNDYGMKIMAEKAALDEAHYKKVGKNEKAVY